MDKSFKKKIGCRSGCLLIWLVLLFISINTLLYMRGSESTTSEIINAIVTIGWIAAFLLVLDGFNVFGDRSYECGKCGSRVFSYSKTCPSCGTQLSASGDVVRRHALNYYIFLGLLICLAISFIAYILDRIFIFSLDYSSLEFAANVFGIAAILVAIIFSVIESPYL